MQLTLKGNILWPDGNIKPGIVRTKGTQIETLAEDGSQAFSDEELFCAPDLGVIAPGFIEMQINGSFGHDFTATTEGIRDVSKRLPQHGVTSFLPTIITSPLENIRNAVANVRTLVGSNRVRGAEVLGLHFEGPYLAASKGGAHNRQHMIQPSLDHVPIFDPKVVRLVTLAPELPGCLPFISALVSNGITVGMGHCEASFNETLAAVNCGASWGTHLFNGMPTLTHREPGIVGALLTDPRLTFGIIADCLHTHPSILELAYRAKGPANVSLITDAIAATGMPPGEYMLGDVPITVDGHSSRTRDAGGLAGSVLTMDIAVKNMLNFTSCTLSAALSMASAVPARILSLRSKGALSVGYDADMVILDKDARVVATIVAGEMVYKSS